MWRMPFSFKAACQAKQRDLRVRSENPCTNVLPPEKGDSRRKEWIYPKEFLALVACEAVPLEWRELYAVACSFRHVEALRLGPIGEPQPEAEARPTVRPCARALERARSFTGHGALPSACSTSLSGSDHGPGR